MAKQVSAFAFIIAIYLCCYPKDVRLLVQAELQ